MYSIAIPFENFLDALHVETTLNLDIYEYIVLS